MLKIVIGLLLFAGGMPWVNPMFFNRPWTFVGGAVSGFGLILIGIGVTDGIISGRR